MGLLDDEVMSMAEREMRKKSEEGYFDDLPLKGKKIDCSVNHNIPSEWRVLKTLSKDANVLPPEVQLQKEINLLLELAREQKGEEEKKEILKKVSLKEMELKLRMEILLKK